MAKKSFKDTNPALQFISLAGSEAPAAAPARPAADQGEHKSKRLNLLLQPSVLAELTKIARMRQTSVNDLINCVLRDFRDQNADEIRRYDRVFGEQ